MSYSDAEVVLASTDKIAVRKDSVTNREIQKIVLYDSVGNPIGAEDLGSGFALYVLNVAKQETQGVFADGDTVTSGMPVYMGGYTATSLTSPTPKVDGKMLALRVTADGRLLSLPYANPEDTVSGVASDTSGASTEVIAAQIASVRTYLTWVHIINTSATATYVELKDGTTVMDRLYVKATDGCYATFPTPLKGTAATAWNFDAAAGVTTLFYAAGGYKSKV